MPGRAGTGHARIRLDIEKHEAERVKLSEPAQIEAALGRLRALVAPVKPAPQDIVRHRALRPFVERIELSGSWNERTGSWRRRACIKWNWVRLLELVDL